MASHDTDEHEPYPAIPRACDMLTMSMYCRNGAAIARSCALESARLVSCGEETIGEVIETLAAIAAKRCLSETAAHEKCLTKYSGQYNEECARTDALALDCAARYVMAQNEQDQ